MAKNPSTASLIWHQNNPSATELRIRTVSIDGLVEAGEIGYPKFVKNDVEGAEGSVLQGMRRTLAVGRSAFCRVLGSRPQNACACFGTWDTNANRRSRANQ